MLLTVILAVGLTILAVGPRGTGFGLGFGNGGEADEASRSPLPGVLIGRQTSPNLPPGTPQPGQASAQTRPNPLVPGAFDIPGSFDGVILWPEIQPVTTLIEPMPTSPTAFASVTHPFGIPFGGEYWFFRPPFRRPPTTSFVQRGTPAKVSFSTTDKWPLNMEAHQKLEQSVDTSCCSRIGLSIRNTDRYPHTVSLEMILRYSPAEPRTLHSVQSLGTLPVRSEPNLDNDPIAPVGETLEFTIPSEPTVHEFNEITVVYHRAQVRADKSARIAIDRFILIPRGR
jgi:hypothetical protein